MHMRLHALLAALALTGCALGHEPTAPPPGTFPEAFDAAVGPPPARAPCAAPLVADDDYCVGWRVIAPPPCDVAGIGRVEGELAIQCATFCVPDPATPMTYVLDGDEWRFTDERAELDAARAFDSLPSTAIDPMIVVELADGSRVAAHGDPYALPAAWRTHVDRTWRDTVAPPSTSIRVGAPVSADVALFLGTDAFVYVRAPR